MSQPAAQLAQAPQFPVVGRWVVTVIPRGWVYLHGFGVRQIAPAPDVVTASIGLGEDALAADSVLDNYIEKQKKLIEQTLKNTVFAGPQPTTFSGADEARLFMVRHEVEGAGNMTHIQTYVRCGVWVGIVTFTAQHALVSAARPDYDAFVRGLYIGPPPQAAQPGQAPQA